MYNDNHAWYVFHTWSVCKHNQCLWKIGMSKSNVLLKLYTSRKHIQGNECLLSFQIVKQIKTSVEVQRHQHMAAAERYISWKVWTVMTFNNEKGSLETDRLTGMTLKREVWRLNLWLWRGRYIDWLVWPWRIRYGDWLSWSWRWRSGTCHDKLFHLTLVVGNCTKSYDTLPTHHEGQQRANTS